MIGYMFSQVFSLSVGTKGQKLDQKIDSKERINIREKNSVKHYEHACSTIKHLLKQKNIIGELLFSLGNVDKHVFTFIFVPFPPNHLITHKQHTILSLTTSQRNNIHCKEQPDQGQPLNIYPNQTFILNSISFCLVVLIFYLFYSLFQISEQQSKLQMIPLLVQKFGAERMSFILFGASQILFPLAFIFANDNKIHTIETNLIRGMVSVMLNLLIARYYNMSFDYKYDVNFKNILKRNVIMVIHGLAITVSQFYLPLPIVHTINFFAPVFIFIIDYLENGIKINRLQTFFLILSILGLISTINNELFESILQVDHEIKSEFKNYIKLSPREFAQYSLLLTGVMFLWAYGLLRVRTYYKNNHTYVNFHLGLMFTVVSGVLYPYQVKAKTDIWILGKSVLMTGLPLALGQLASVAGLALNKKTGEIVILSGLPVFVGYMVSYFRYEQSIESFELVGSIMILIGLLGVIQCGGESQIKEELMDSRMIGEVARLPTATLYKVLRLG